MRQRLLFALLMLAAASAHAQQTAPSQVSAYRQVMQAQYAADAAPLPQRSEEARRVYESYLRSLGQSAGGPASGGSPGEQSRDGFTNSGSMPEREAR